MDPISAMALVSSPAGAKGGGASLPSFDQQIKSSASSALDSSGTSYNQSTGDFIVGGGSKNASLLMFAGLAVLAFFLLKR